MSNTTLRPPTQKQLRYLRTLAKRTGTTFTAPTTTSEASREINRMQRLTRSRELPDHREAPTYGTAPVASEVTGHGIRCHWRHSTLPTQENPGGSSDPPAPARTARAAVLARHHEDGAIRQVLSVPRGDARLIVDRLAAGGDARLLARLGPEEPPENAALITRLYLRDPRVCRRLRSDDLDTSTGAGTEPTPAAVAWQAPLVAGIGATFRLQPLRDGRRETLRWSEHTRETNGTPNPVSLRHVIATLEDYQPALAMSETALRAAREHGCAVATLRSELGRLTASSIVLNCRLRERVQRAVETRQTTMSAIALRCGRSKRSATGRESGETSWLARRIGVLAEAGATRPTPWVHVDVLAVIARDGLGINPSEVEMH